MQVFATDVLARDVTAAACRETEVALYVQAVLYENVPGTGGRQAADRACLDMYFLYPFGFCGVFGLFHAYDQCPMGIHLYTDVRQDGLACTDFHGRFILRWDINHIDRRRG